jgi:hypothetical protein
MLPFTIRIITSSPLLLTPMLLLPDQLNAWLSLMQSFAIQNFPCLVGRSLPVLHRVPLTYELVICYNVQGTQMLWYLVPDDGHFHLGLSARLERQLRRLGIIRSV